MNEHTSDGASALRAAREEALRDRARDLGFVLIDFLPSPDATGDTYILLDLTDYPFDLGPCCISSMTLDEAEEYIDEQDT